MMPRSTAGGASLRAARSCFLLGHQMIPVGQKAEPVKTSRMACRVFLAPASLLVQLLRVYDFISFDRSNDWCQKSRKLHMPQASSESLKLVALHIRTSGASQFGVQQGPTKPRFSLQPD